ncbi:hypothetical protein JCM9140_735 [Halalkalibacter wakoensis JCM 9140]|uniref:Uncharacterized protein n=1 Tax=Halalkalibacter wakoensis JCM 9140 TaxID=1236970 RepID=W4PZ64_9BACI|nr:hypothetical protein [Halalkalibacter wakoensis]GAE24783.1 hypothetical protein JCM9140_735 [Halalkalibacter wakoensis JCM 9140]
MFRGNKPVLILPAILAIIMILGGYHFLQGSETITNEELQDVMEFELDYTQTEKGIKLTGEWDWTIMPQEGLYGEDYIGIVVMDQETGVPRTDVDLQGSLELLYAGQPIEQTDGTTVDNGLIFSFSNKLVEHESFGNIGQFEVLFDGEGIDKEDIIVTLLHTWTEHAPLDKTDALLVEPTFIGAANVPYWTVEKRLQ